MRPPAAISARSSIRSRPTGLSGLVTRDGHETGFFGGTIGSTVDPTEMGGKRPRALFYMVATTGSQGDRIVHFDDDNTAMMLTQ